MSVNETKKAVPLRKQLGADVSIDVQKLPKDMEANEILHRIGQNYAETQPGMEYCGTIAIHIYCERNSIAKQTYSLSQVTNIAMKRELSESAILTVWQNAAIRIRSYFNPEWSHRSTDSKDKRGSVK
jgi:hypothetical protein